MSNVPQKNLLAKPKETTQGKRGDLEVSVLHSRCIGAAVCVFEAKGAFKLNQDNKAIIVDLKKASKKAIINCARNCPMQAIFLYRNKKQIWPEPKDDSMSYQPGPETKMLFD